MRSFLAAIITAVSTLMAVSLPIAGPASASPPPEVAAAIPDAKPVGRATFSLLFWDLFEGSLWSNDGSFSWEAPLALSLTYNTDFTAEELTDQTIDELDRLTNWSKVDLATFRSTIAPCMANVGSGDRFTALSAGADTVQLFLNGKAKCQLNQPGLRRAYLQIWLSEDSRFPSKSRQLTGLTR